MAEEKNNEHHITGTVYSKLTRKAEGKKATNKGTIYEFYYYILEVPYLKRWVEQGESGMKERSVTKKELIKFSLPREVSPDDFSIGDNVDVTFTITGREWVNREGVKDTINENKMISIRFADTQVGGRPTKTDVFTPPQFKPENQEEDDLPF